MLLMRYIKIDIATQRLQLFDENVIILEWLVSTAYKGVGELAGSGCTPRGWLVIRAKVGKNCPINSVFVGRRFTGEIYSPDYRVRYPQRDWILTRLLWLGGLEPIKNRYGKVDTLRRFIYIHGCPDEEPMGIPLSHGCIRMRNQDIMTLFEQVDVGTRVLIVEH
jgi:hypothetical protein